MQCTLVKEPNLRKNILPEKKKLKIVFLLVCITALWFHPLESTGWTVINNGILYTDNREGGQKTLPDYMLNSLLGKRAPRLQSYDLPKPKTFNPIPLATCKINP